MRILLVDDHAIVRVGLKQMLADAFEQLEVTEAGTGQEAVAKVQDGSWDLVVLDINLPDTNGLDVLKKLKTLRTGLPVVVNTSLNTAGRPMVDTPREAMELFGSAPVDLLALGPFAVHRRALGGAR